MLDIKKLYWIWNPNILPQGFSKLHRPKNEKEAGGGALQFHDIQVKGNDLNSGNDENSIHQ